MLKKIIEKITLEKKLNVDYTISVGVACRAAHHLRLNGLRRCSNPLDWMMSYSLDTVIHLFKTDFEDFFEEKKEVTERSKHGFRCIQDTKNCIKAIHSFPMNKEIEETYPEFKETMKRRVHRMKKCILASNRVLFVSNRNEPIENFEKFLTQINEIIPCKYTFINVRYENISGIKKTSKKIHPNLEIIDYSFADTHPEGSTNKNPKFWMGNPKKWKQILKQVKLTPKLRDMVTCMAPLEDKKQK